MLVRRLGPVLIFRLFGMTAALAKNGVAFPFFAIPEAMRADGRFARGHGAGLLAVARLSASSHRVLTVTSAGQGLATRGLCL
jgi:hypothetical protein